MYGPTAVGKTELVNRLAQEIPSEIINADMGQLYVPLTIGTAKPDWRHALVPHRLFDVVSEPRMVTVVEYRKMLLEQLHAVWQKKKLPIVVGGSGFYIRSVLYPPIDREEQVPAVMTEPVKESSSGKNIWNRLYEIDPERAQQIEPGDTYRINRALSLWESTGVKPSLLAPIYDPPGNYLLLCLTRDRKELYQRINERVVQMLDAGWIDEVRQLVGTDWEKFLVKKKLIGYDDIVHYLHGPQGPGQYEELVTLIQQRTRNYAKRQLSFWRMLERNVCTSLEATGDRASRVQLQELTDKNFDVYSKQIKNELMSLLTDDKYGKST